jgi:hypothetical protein
MWEGSNLAEHINVFDQVIADLGKVDVKIDNEDMAIILMCSLPGSYEHWVTTLTYGWMKLLQLCWVCMSKGGRTIYLKILLEVLL